MDTRTIQLILCLLCSASFVIIPVLLCRFMESPWEKQERKLERLNKRVSKKRFEDVLVSVIKNKDHDVRIDKERNGIIIDPDEKIYPMSNLDDLYDLFRCGISVEQMANELLKLKKPCKHTTNHFKSLIKDKLTYRLMNTELHEETLNYLPHKEVCNDISMCLVGHVYGEDGEHYEKVINKSMFTQYMWVNASNNAPEIEPPVMYELNEGLDDDERENVLLTGMVDDDSRYIVSSVSRRYGASVLFYDGLKERIYELLGAYYALPTSVNEWTILPDNGDYDGAALKTALREINETLEPNEILSYTVYYFDGDELIAV